MKFLSIGDLHGLNVWTQFEDIPQLLAGKFKPNFDKYIFVGDYTDSFSVSNVDIFNNLKQLVEFKQKYPNHVVLLLGNHDLQYWFSHQTHGCSGFRSEMYWDLNEFFRTHKDLFQIAFQHKNYLWTHAGIHRGWYEYRFPYNSNIDVAKELNKAFLMNEKSLFDVGYSRGGFRDVGGPFWCDYRHELQHKPLKGYNQIIGHTRQLNGIAYKEFKNHTSVTCIDVLEDRNNLPNNGLYHILDLSDLNV